MIPLLKAWRFTTAEDIQAPPKAVDSREKPEIAKVSSLKVDNTLLDEKYGIANTSSGKQIRSANEIGSPKEIQDETKNRSLNQFPHSESQLKSIESNAPAVLLKSGPGTGKTYALAARIAYLIRTGACQPEHMVLLSFTNRDARSLKSLAMDMLSIRNNENATTHSLSKKEDEVFSNLTQEELSSRLWCGTIHSFAVSLYRNYATKPRRSSIRVLSSKEMRMRVDKCLVRMLANQSFLPKKTRRKDGSTSEQKLRSLRLVYRDALADLRQSRGMLLHQVTRCLELWKESGLLPPPSGNKEQVINFDSSHNSVRDNCIEVSMRLGIPQSVGWLALEVFPEYQALHDNLGTADPSDLASMTYNLLVNNPDALNALRTKLHHVVLDEYQDVSVTQHALLRLLIRGLVDETTISLDSSRGRIASSSSSTPPVLPMSIPLATMASKPLNFNVPQLFCAGDSDQSIYGWRGAAPSLSVEGFRADYPQGVVIPLDTSYRLPRNIWNAASALAGNTESKAPKGYNHVQTFPTSPVALRNGMGIDKPRRPDDDCSNETLAMLLSSQGNIDERTTSVHIQGLWDSREEAKYVASRIRKRSKERVAAHANVMKTITDESGVNEELNDGIRDPSDVAVMVRSTAQMKLIKEALNAVGVPFVTADGDDSKERNKSPPTSKEKSKHSLVMKPVVLMTMHRAKGEEFDDVYTLGWNEGVFPHPSAISTNRVQEERRLGFVGITRARQKLVITHSFVSRDLHLGPDLMHKHVTTQVEPSRFLYELVPTVPNQPEAIATTGSQVISRNSCNGVPNIVWDRGTGFKEIVAGQNLPDFFAKSYSTPRGYVPSTSAPRHQSRISQNGPKDPNNLRAASSLSEVMTACASSQEKNKRAVASKEPESGSEDLGRKTFGITLKGKPCKLCLKQRKFCSKHKHQEVRGNLV